MAENIGSTVPGRQLGRLLRELRTSAGMTVEGAARALRCTPPKLWRIERGAGPVRGREVRSICELYGVPDDLALWLVRLAAEVGSGGWWRSYGDPLPDGLDLYAGLEAAACRLREYHHALIPALLQTRAYASALLAQPPAVPEPERERRVEARLRRQVLLHRSLPAPVRFDVMLSEVALRAEGFGPGVMSEQLRHLVEVGRLPHVSVRVMPLSAGLHLGALSGPFVLLDFPPQGMRRESEPPVVYREWLTGELYLDRPEEIAAYEKVWADLDAIALDKDQSRHLVSKIIEASSTSS